MSDHDHDHHGHHHPLERGHSELPETELRVHSLESILTEKVYVYPTSLDLLIYLYEKKIGPRNGIRVVAKAWSDPAYRERLMKDATAAIAELDYSGRQGEHMVVVENTPEQHNMVVCTLCSCYPHPVLGLPPVWYKSAPYRSRAVSDLAVELNDVVGTLPDATKIRDWYDTTQI